MSDEYVSGRDMFRTHCPIESCTWTHDVPTALGRITCEADPVTGAPLVEAGINRALAERKEARDAAVSAHCEEHDAAEWAAEVGRLRQVVAAPAGGGDVTDRIPAEPLPPDVVARQGVHAYVSTACHHGLHPRCRRDCKFCAAPCRCHCHDEEAP